MTRRSLDRARWVPGRDRRAVHHPAEPGGSKANGRSVIVVGGGIAGLAAAAGLAERGVAVTLLEREAQLGGRVASWTLPADPGSPAGERTMSRGFHAFFRQYYNLRALLRRTDPALERLIPLADYPLVLAGGHRDSFASIPRTPPLNLLTFVAQSPSFTARDLSKVDVPAALELLDVAFPDTYERYDGESAAHFLDRLHFPEPARHLALEVFARSFFADPEDFSAGELVAMFHSYFVGSSEGLLFDVPDDDYDTTLWAPLGRYLDGLGVRIRTGVQASRLDLSDDQARVELDNGQTLTADAVVLAVDPVSSRNLVLAADGLSSDSAAADWQRRIGAIDHAPPFAVWRVWLDRLVDSERPPFLGTSGYGPLDNISVLERFEAGARDWSGRHGGSVVELHAYAAHPRDWAGADGTIGQSLKDRLWFEAARLYPELARSEIVADQWLVRQDCPMIGTGPWRDRPEVATPDPRLVLAGDYVRCDFPVALMERAATTGWQAANTLLAGWQVTGHDLWTVPLAGRVLLVKATQSLLAVRG